MSEDARQVGLPSWTPLDDATTMEDLDHLTDLHGPLLVATRRRIYAAVVDPCRATWREVRLTYVDGPSRTTLWQAVTRWGGYDQPLLADCPPDEQQVRRGLHGAAVHARARAAYRLAAQGEAGPFEQQPDDVQDAWRALVREQDRRARATRRD